MLKMSTSILPNLRIIRMGRCFTQKELAQRAGLSLGLVEALEQGTRINPSFRTLAKLAMALQVPVAMLIDGMMLPLPPLVDSGATTVQPTTDASNEREVQV